MLDLWKKWEDIHTAPDQQKRIETAKKAECTPLTIDKTEGKATFSGTHGKYTTTLEACQCVDFMRRKLPRKHIYRLAMECGVFSSGTVISDSNEIKAPALTKSERKEVFLQVIDKIEKYDDDIQSKIREIIYHSNVKKLYPCENVKDFDKVIADGFVETIYDCEQVLREHTQKLTLEKLENAGFQFPEGLKTTKKAHFEWCLKNAEYVARMIYPYFVFLRPAGLLKVVQKKAYTYLLRKFTNDSIWNGEGKDYIIPHGAEMSVTVSENGISSLIVQFPDDDITDLLDKYGVNRCRNWKNE